MNAKGLVLLVEDEETLSTTLRELIRRRGHDCDTAGTVEAGLHALENTTYDAIVTDIHLPDGNNLEMLEAIHRRRNAPPVIVITGFPSLENALQAIERSAFAYRVKPFDFQELLSLVDQAVAHGRLHRKVSQSATRITELANTLGTLRAAGARASRESLDQTAIEYLLLLMSNNADSLAEAMEILQALQDSTGNQPLRRLAHHPEAEMLRAALTHTIDVLEATRRSFKSKELGDLRQQLQTTLALVGKSSPSP